MSRDQGMSREQMVQQLAEQTGMEVILAEEYLSSNNWNYVEAWNGYNRLVEQEKKRKGKEFSKFSSKPARGFSVSNLDLVKQVREKLTVDEKALNEEFPIFGASARKCFILPDISKFDRELAGFIKKDLISTSTLQALYSAGRLNWWAEFGTCRKLFPLSTVGDGNCLLHAASLGMWGFHDRLLRLRKALHELLLTPLAKKALKRRWKYSLWKENMKMAGLTYNHDEWDEEWNVVVKLTSDRPRRIEGGIPSRRISRQLSQTSVNIGSESGPSLKEGESLDSLEAIHVYALANLLCRPIIIIAEEMLKDAEGNDVAPIPFGGIYLPLERQPEICCRYPLVLAYDASHFSALVPADGETMFKDETLSTSVPLEDRSFQILPIRFAVDPGNSWDLVQDDSVKNELPELDLGEKVDLLRQYLDLVKVSFNDKVLSSDLKKTFKRDLSVGKVIDHVQSIMLNQPQRDLLLATKLNVKERPDRYDEMMRNYLDSVKHRYLEASRKCSGCNNSAHAQCEGYCADCYNAKVRSSARNQDRKKSADLLVKRTAVFHDNIVPKQNNIESTNKAVESIPFNAHSMDAPRTVQRVVPITDARSDTRLQTDRSIMCRSHGCRFYGSNHTAGFCSSCYRNYVNKR